MGHYEVCTVECFASIFIRFAELRATSDLCPQSSPSLFSSCHSRDIILSIAATRAARLAKNLELIWEDHFTRYTENTTVYRTVTFT
jgi:hypothetical protein